MFNSDVFTGISVQLPQLTTDEDRRSLVSQFKGIKESWPVQEVMQVPESTAEEVSNEKEEELGKKPVTPPRMGMRHSRLGRRARNDDIESPWNHLMTHVDKLHEEGYTGGGIRIAVVDTGVNYKQPALGGCFGPGCKVVTGENFSSEGDKSDPMDCHGHGTFVSSVLAGYDEAKGFVGAAPNATIMAYRVLNCFASGTEDDMIAGWLKAKEDGAQIIISSSGFEGVNWAQSPLAMVAARIVASGVPCVVGLGNKKRDGLFNAMNPSTGHGVTAVNSFGRADGTLEHRGEYLIGNRSETVDFLFEPGGELGNWDGELRPMHDVDADFGDKPDDDLRGANNVPIRISAFDEIEENCKLSPGNSSTGFDQDLVSHIALIRQTPETKECHFYDRVQNFYDRVQNAIARGAEHILAWQAKPTHVEIRRMDAMGRPVKAIGITGADVGRAMARALASGQPVTARIIGRVRIETGHIADKSAYGPTWELDIKPTIGAPGQSVPVIHKNGDYGSESGTSFAAPLVAGAFALISQVRGTFDPALLNSLIMSTAEPQIEDGRLITVAQQGGGLLKAWEAAHATTLVEPGALTFNDTDNRPGSIALRITNTANTEVTYQLSNLAATTLYTFESGSILPGAGEAADATADIKLSQTSITIGAGGSLRSAAVLDPASALSSLSGSEYILRNPPKGQKPGPSKAIENSPGAIPSYAISASLNLVLGSPMVRVDIVPLDICSTSASENTTSVGTRGLAGLARRVNATEPDLSQACVPDSIVTEFAGVKSIGQLPGYPKHYVKREKLNLKWSGAFTLEHYAPPGRYQIVARALSIMGDASNEAHWQTVKSPVFSILYEHNVNVPEADQQPSEEDSSTFSEEEQELAWADFLNKNPEFLRPQAGDIDADVAKNSSER
ncbi:hypothetical protein ACQRIT_006013 [Beauveria bassiana]